MINIISYYTKDTPYEDLSHKFEENMREYNLSYYLYPVDNLGKWELNCAQKSIIIKSALAGFPEYDILYIDIDAIVMRQPPFETIHRNLPGICFAGAKTLASGTIFFPNNKASMDLVDRWITKQKEEPMEWDQRVLYKVLKMGEYYRMSDIWCSIKDIQEVPNAVIFHTQKSREFKSVINKT